MGLDVLICVDDLPNQMLSQQVSSVEVYEKMDMNTTFKLNFMIDVCDDDIDGQIEGDTAPGKTISILAKVNDELVCLVKGPITQQEAHIQHGGSGSWLHVEGEDTGKNLDHKPNYKVTDNASDSDIAYAIISGEEHMIPDIESTPHSLHTEENHSHVQTESDLNLLRTLAQRNGFHFWITYSPLGIATGHFKSRDLDGTPKLVLIVNHENYNIESLRVSADTRLPSQTEGKQVSPRTKEVIGDTASVNDTALGKKGLAQISGDKKQTIHYAPPADDSGGLQKPSEAVIKEAQWFISATCSTNLQRLCGIVHNHTIVEVKGAGKKHSGKYYVTGVKHVINSVNHNMELEMARNAWGN